MDVIKLLTDLINNAKRIIQLGVKATVDIATEDYFVAIQKTGEEVLRINLKDMPSTGSTVAYIEKADTPLVLTVEASDFVTANPNKLLFWYNTTDGVIWIFDTFAATWIELFHAVETIVGGTGITVDATNPKAPIVNLSSGLVLTFTGGLTETAQVVTMTDMAQDTIKGRITASTGTPEDLTAAQVRTIINVESGATADQTGAEIKTLYEAQPNAFTDTKNTKLTGIETAATADQTGAEIKVLYESELDTNAFTDALLGKLNGVEVLATADQTQADINALNIDAQKVGGLFPASFFQLTASQDVTGDNKITGGLVFENDSQSGYIPFPKGAFLRSTSSTETGAIKIVLPTHGTGDFIGFVVDIYDDSVGESVAIHIKADLSGATGIDSWRSETVSIITNDSTKDFTVRFGGDATNSCVWIGELTDTWTFPQVIVRDFFGGFTTDIDAYSTGWNISVVTAFDTIDDVISGNLPISSINVIAGNDDPIIIGTDKQDGLPIFRTSIDITAQTSLITNGLAQEITSTDITNASLHTKSRILSVNLEWEDSGNSSKGVNGLGYVYFLPSGRDIVFALSARDPSGRWDAFSSVIVTVDYKD